VLKLYLGGDPLVIDGIRWLPCDPFLQGSLHPATFVEANSHRLRNHMPNPPALGTLGG
jgi:hypothetical protein